MNSEERNVQDQTSLESIQQNSFNPLFILALIVGGSVVVYRLLKLFEESFLDGNLPPIIIKSGSFDIEADEPLDESGGMSGNPFIYKRIGFGEIKGVRVFRINERSGKAKSSDYYGVEVDIRLQQYVSSGWQNINPLVIIRSKVNPSNPKKDFVLEIGKKLDIKGKPKPGRKEKRFDKGTDILRFGSVIVRKANGDEVLFDDDGDEYIISFYNSLV
jgi:hypothetical protein